MRPDDFDFELPDELVAQRPTERRGQSRLLVVGPPHRHHRADELPDLLDARARASLARGDATSGAGAALVVVNDSKVVPARLELARGRGGTFEALVCEPRSWSPGEEVHAWIRGAKKLRAGDRLVAGAVRLRYEGRDARDDRRCVFVLEEGDLFAELLAHGQVPLPPYIRRPRGELELDRERYQCVYARHAGSIAAPTAGLHLDHGTLSRLDVVGVTLHVGPGTFLPMTSEDVRDHRVGVEHFEIGDDAARRIEAARAAGRPILAVGTTVTRTLESVAAASGGRIVAGRGATDLVIHPGFEFGVVDALLTNFHLPRSSLLMLVSAFAGRERVLEAYRAAVADRYRFYSYGDCMLVTRGGS